MKTALFEGGGSPCRYLESTPKVACAPSPGPPTGDGRRAAIKRFMGANTHKQTIEVGGECIQWKANVYGNLSFAESIYL